MLVVIPPQLFGRLGAALSALIVILSLVGLTMHKDVYAHRPRQGFFVFYTNISTLLVLLYFSLLAPLLYAKSALRTLIPHIEFGVTMSIMLTHVVFHFLIFPCVRRQYACASPSRERSIVYADNWIIHYIVPWLVFIYWIACSPQKSRLLFLDAMLWTVVPAVYLLIVLLTAPLRPALEETGSPYPYPFLDVQQRGLPRVLFTSAGLFLLCMLAGAILIFLTRLALSAFGSGHALFLI